MDQDHIPKNVIKAHRFLGVPFCGLCVNLFGRALYNCKILGQIPISLVPIDAHLKLMDDQ